MQPTSLQIKRISLRAKIAVTGKHHPLAVLRAFSVQLGNEPIQKRPQSAPMYNVRGCGDRLLPGGHFNKSGAHKEMFRFTYLDEA